MLKKTKKAQITVETSIILPLIMLVIGSFIYISFYVHDVIAIRSRVYSVGIEYSIGESEINHKNINKNLFVMRPQIKIEERIGSYMITIKYISKGNTNFINRIITKKEEDVIKIEKTMSREILYGNVAIKGNKTKGE